MEQGELADRIGISRGTVGNYELNRGQRPPKVVILRAWAHECGVPYEWLVDGFRGPGVRHQGLEPRTRWFGGPRRYLTLIAA
jgi:transcriptional regulator with XRE-family HTH domain